MTSDPTVVDAPENPWTHRPPEDAAAAELMQAFREMILHPDYPCLGARSVITRHRACVHVLPELGTAESGRRMLTELAQFAADTDVEEGFASFVAIFRHPEHIDEETFEQLLWQQLQHIADADHTPWSGLVSQDPDDPHFAFSASGTPYFVVGLHPEASRIARRAPWPTLVFNLHEQFENLRAEGKFERMRTRIRCRDSELQGCPNPMVGDFGDSSEARQYSGRAVDDQWSPDADFTPARHSGGDQ